MSGVFLSTNQIAELLGVNIVTVRRYIKSGKLKAVLIGKEYRVEVEDYKKFILKK